jgi:hypothetical protein
MSSRSHSSLTVAGAVMSANRSILAEQGSGGCAAPPRALHILEHFSRGEDAALVHEPESPSVRPRTVRGETGSGGGGGGGGVITLLSNDDAAEGVPRRVVRGATDGEKDGGSVEADDDEGEDGGLGNYQSNEHVVIPGVDLERGTTTPLPLPLPLPLMVPAPSSAAATNEERENSSSMAAVSSTPSAASTTALPSSVASSASSSYASPHAAAATLASSDKTAKKAAAGARGAPSSATLTTAPSFASSSSLGSTSSPSASSAKKPLSGRARAYVPTAAADARA